MKTPLIIDRPDLQSLPQRAASAVVTAFFWLLWASLWMPLITLGAWFFFGQRFHLQMVVLDGYQTFLGLLGVYALVILLMGGGLVVWALYNNLRFRGVDSRKAPRSPTTATLATHYGRAEKTIRQWSNAQVVTVHHDKEGTIIAVHPVGASGRESQYAGFSEDAPPPRQAAAAVAQ